MLHVFILLLHIGYIYFWVIISVTFGLVIQFTHTHCVSKKLCKIVFVITS